MKVRGCFGDRVSTIAWSALASLLAIVVAAPNASANDAAVGGRGIDLSPIQETRIHMVSEDIRIAQVEGAQFSVHAIYIFENPGDEAVALRMGFPERRCDDDTGSDCNSDGSFSAMRTSVDGALVEHTIEEVGPRTEWGEELGRIFVFRVDLAAGERKTVEHHYTYTGTDTVMGVELEYVTRTGALWGGPIEDATFTITFNKPVCEIWMHESMVAAIVERTTTAEGMSIKLHYDDWTPERDIVFPLIAQGWDQCIQTIRSPCPQFSESDLTHASAVDFQNMSAEVAANRGYDLAELRICRNLPYAMLGYPFRSADLRATFYGLNTDAGWSDGTRRIGMSPNTADGVRENFALSDLHSRYVRIILGAERLRAGGQE